MGSPHSINRVRFAGSWYDADPSRLGRLLQNALDEAGPTGNAKPREGRLRGAVVPHAGLAYSAAGMAPCFAAVDARTIDRVIVMAPSHTARLEVDRLHVERFDRHQTPLGEIAGDPEFWDADSTVEYADAAVEREHAVEMLLPFIRLVLPDEIRLSAILVPVLTSVESVAERANQIASALERSGGRERTLILVSSDFTHYGRRFDYTPFGVDPMADVERRVADHDLALADDIAAGAVARIWDRVTSSRTTVCGRYPILVGTALADGFGYSGERVLYYTSNENHEPSADFVAYATILFTDNDSLKVSR